ncbi:efflux RND transporter periplasmic adaptor subunit [Virgibacillus sp. DJP39]|uniref:efflux RND transporter periplasmic adaptor subunit n=1 Tax=Virgibacillus sp. DJP39 TaxID=3409790 RepID=UPI003BB5B95A
MRKLRITLVVLFLLLVLAACNNDDNENTNKEETVTPVKTTSVTQGDLVIDRSVYGRTSPSSITPVMIQTPGEIITLKVENGDQVEEDDVIATIQTPQGKQTIYAETSGEIAQLQGTEGTIATNQKPLAVITDLDELTLNLTVTAEATSLFEVGEKYPILIDEMKVDAEIKSIGTLPNDAGLYPIEAVIQNKNNKLLSGMVAEMTVPENTINDTLIVPTEAVNQAGGKTFVYVIEDKKAIRKEVNVIETHSDNTALEGDVKKGDMVVTSGSLTLTDGSKVNVVKEG